jgi:hypothetical protein
MSRIAVMHGTADHTHQWRKTIFRTPSFAPKMVNVVPVIQKIAEKA